MIIRSKIERAKGSVITIGDTTYHFKPRAADGHHVAEVTNKEHLGRFLSITEGYELADEYETKASTEPLASPPTEGEKASAELEAKLNAMSESDLIATYGPGTEMDLKLSRRMLHQTIVDRIIDRIEEIER